MALHDFRCPACGAVRRDVYVPITQRASQVLIPCLRCRPVAVAEDGADHTGKFFSVMEWIPQIGRMDCGSVKGASFQAFDVQRRQPDGSYRNERVTSVHQMRRIERESETAHRNGEGEALRFRMWSNDRTNSDVNTFGPDPAEQAQAEIDRMRRALPAGRKGGQVTPIGAADAEAILGPGVTEETASPFPVLP